MPTVKTQDGKVVTKDGKVSCECCEPPSIGCPIAACVPSSGDFNNPAVCFVSQATALLYKGGGTWTLSVVASLDASFDLVFIDQRYKAILSGSGSAQVVSSNSCNISGSITPVSLTDDGGLFRLSTDELLVPPLNGTLAGGFSLQIRETSTTPRVFCIRLNLVPRFLDGNYLGLGIGFGQLATSNTTLSFNGCNLVLAGLITAKAPFSSGGTNLQGSGSYSATLTFAPSAP